MRFFHSLSPFQFKNDSLLWSSSHTRDRLSKAPTSAGEREKEGANVANEFFPFMGSSRFRARERERELFEYSHLMDEHIE